MTINGRAYGPIEGRDDLMLNELADAGRYLAWTRNGNRSLQELAHHMREDIGWAWAPGFGRRPAPGTQKQAGALFEAWVRTGAVCPN
jgi:hypothetical protein